MSSGRTYLFASGLEFISIILPPCSPAYAADTISLIASPMGNERMARVKCPKCFHVNPDGQDECVRCHAPLPRIRIDARPGPTPAVPRDVGEAQFARGQIVAARYSVLNLIGRGGMGAIYKVHDNVLGETVALKTLLPQFVRA